MAASSRRLQPSRDGQRSRPGGRSAGRTPGQFFTPADVARLAFTLVRRLAPDVLAPGARVVDPACGEGVFLREEAWAGIVSQPKIVGRDLDPTMAAAWGGVPGELQVGDGLALASGWADVVVGNPPFVRGKVTRPEFVLARAGLPIEAVFLEQATRLARPRGVVAMVVPEGLLANWTTRTARDLLVAEGSVLAVVALPRGTFRSEGTMASTALVVWRRSRPSTPRVVMQATDGRTWAAPRQRFESAWRWDVRYWDPAYAVAHPGSEVIPLGELTARISIGDGLRGNLGEGYTSSGPAYLKAREVLESGYDTSHVARVSEATYARLKRTQPREDDLIVVRSGQGSVGRVYAYDLGEARACVGDAYVITIRGCDPLWVAAYLKSSSGRLQLSRLENGVCGVTHLNQRELAELLVPLPTAEQASAARAGYAALRKAHANWIAWRRLAGGGAAKAAVEGALEQLRSVVEASLCARSG